MKPRKIDCCSQAGWTATDDETIVIFDVLSRIHRSLQFERTKFDHAYSNTAQSQIRATSVQKTDQPKLPQGDL